VIPTLFCALWFLSGPRACSSFQHRLGVRGREAWDVEVVGRPHGFSTTRGSRDPTTHGSGERTTVL
jgi:hypothetical protein